MKKFLSPFIIAISLIGLPAVAQNPYTIKVEPEVIEVPQGQEFQLSATVYDSDGKAIDEPVLFFSGNRNAVEITREGLMKGLKPGTFSISARYFGEVRIRERIPVTILPLPLEEIEITGLPKVVYTETTVPLTVTAKDTTGLVREDVNVQLTSSDESILAVNDINELVVRKKGKVTITATAEDITTTAELTVKENPVVSVELSHNYSDKTVRTGDVVHFSATPRNSKGETINDVPVTFSFIAKPDDNLGQGASGLMEQDGRFVANHAGTYTVLASTGNYVAQTSFRVVYRNVRRPIEVVGKGIIPDVKTSDLWVWEGVDGRDYAVTGTWGARGEAFFWDVTDPSDIYTIDTVKVDARTVNDVKVSEDGTIAVITREGASDRKNGIIILDVTNPRNVKILSEYTEGLTGGVHNSFIYENHVYAVNNGRKYDIINIEDPENPETVGVFELDTPGHSIHDVWIEDGIAYSSNWRDGIIAVDIGSNTSADMPGAGGSPENPVKLGSYEYPSGWNHAAFPFKSKSTGDFYIAAGDEAFPYGLTTTGPNRAAGWIHFIKFDDWESPTEVARYQVPEAGSHNYWIEDDILYAAFYNGGLRVVDISGELMGDLYQQGREIAMFVPADPDAVIPNSAFTWGPQPYKGHIFISDWNSGLWVLKVGESTSGGTR